MTIPLIIACFLTVFAFFLHTIIGDKELRIIEPGLNAGDGSVKQEKWTMARCGWHWLSLDLLLASIGMGLILFSDYLPHESFLLKILAFYFFGYGLVWFITVFISKDFPLRFLKLGQWILLWLISGLLFLSEYLY